MSKISLKDNQDKQKKIIKIVLKNTYDSPATRANAGVEAADTATFLLLIGATGAKAEAEARTRKAVINLMVLDKYFILLVRKTTV